MDETAGRDRQEEATDRLKGVATAADLQPCANPRCGRYRLPKDMRLGRCYRCAYVWRKHGREWGDILDDIAEIILRDNIDVPMKAKRIYELIHGA